MLFPRACWLSRCAWRLETTSGVVLDAVEQHERTATLFDAAIREIGGFRDPAAIRVLDIGTGSGLLVRSLSRLGYDVQGCDVHPYWQDAQASDHHKLSLIQTSPYRLPFEDDCFDVVLSNSVLEHAQNKPEMFREMRRVLRFGGCAMHLFPSRWYLPVEPHIYVPLANFFPTPWPRWWLGLWALLGIHNEFQRGLDWRAVVDANARYCREGLSYWTKRQFRRESMTVFGNFSMPMDFYLANAHGGAATLLRKLRVPGIAGWLIATFREMFIVQRKTGS